MDEQKAWIRARRKRRLRFTAAILAFCLLTTTYPNILETISVFAAGLRGDGGTMSITGFVELPEETAKQTVPVGTDRSELELPDTLEAYVTVEDKNDTEDDKKPDDGEQDKDDDENDSDSGQDKGDQENPDEGADENGDDKENTDEGDGSGGNETGDGSNENGEGDDKENTDDGIENPGGEEVPGVDNDADSEEESDEVASGFGIQTGSFLMPVYMSENPEDALTVETLENTLLEGAESAPDTDNGGTADHTERNAETVMIKGITWQSEPVYDGDVEETYIFTAVLPEGFALTEGVSLPQITVTVQDDAAVQALLARIDALPDAQEYMEKEPDIDDWEGDEDAYEETYAEWMEGLLVYAEEALAIWEEYEALTKEQQAQIPEELLAKLTAWVKIAEQVAGNTMMMAADHTHNSITFIASTSTTSLPSSGNNYLTNNVNLSASSFSGVTSGTMNFCLNGKTITGENREKYAIFQANGATLNLYDCGSGKVYVTRHNAVSVFGNGTANIYGGTLESGGTSAAVNIAYNGDDYSGGTLNIYGGILKGPRGVHVANEFETASVSIRGGTITGSVDGIRMVSGNLTLYGGTINGGSGYAVNAVSPATVTVAGNTALNTAIYTEKSIIASGTGVSGLSTTYHIVYNNVANGTVVVKGSTDTTHYQLDSDTYGLVASGGNLIAKGKYAVTYHENGGTIENKSSYESYTNGAGLTLPTPTRTGYTFDGWYTSSALTGTKQTSISTTATGAKTYYAKWTANTYTVTYNKDGGTVANESNYTSYTYGAGLTLPTPTKTGYTFGGWYTVPGLTGTKQTGISGTATGDKEYWAKWTANTYTVTYNKDGGTIANESNYTSYTYGTELTLPTPIRTGYTFGGWYEDAACSGTKVTKISTTDTGNKTYYAKWTANSYTITYKDKNNAAFSGTYGSNNPTKHTYGTATTLVSPTKTGYDFNGWYTDSGCTGSPVTSLGATSYTANITLYAKWTAATYTVTYNKDGGTIANESSYTSYTYGTGLALPTPTRTGYTFGGWYTSSDFSGTAVTKISTTDTGNKTYYAKWTANSYTITYKDKNNAAFSGTHGSNYPTKHTYGTATTLVSPTKTGYDFNGWYTDSGCTGSPVTSLGATSYTGNITLYAKWTANTYTVTYNKDGGTIANESNYESYTYGTGLTLPTPTRTGYTFGGWYTSSALSGTKQTSISTTATGAKTYYAKWTANTYTVTYNKDGGTIANESNYTSYTYGTGLTLPTPKRPGHTFGGWYGDSGLTGTAVTEISATATGAKTYYAKWTAAAVTINATKCTHDGADKVGESGGYSVTFTPESGYSIPARVTVRIGGATLASDGYTYDNTTGTLTIPRDKITGDVTITAKAVKNPVKSGAGKDDPDNTAPAGEPDEDGGKVTYTGTYGEEYTPVIKAGGQEVDPGAEITWDEGEGKGEWTYRADPDDEITVEFRKRAVTGITVTPGTLTIYADDAANESIAALTAYLKEHSSAQASYDNQTKGTVQADYTTADSFAVKGRTYSYTASADGKTAGIILKVASVTAAATAPAELTRVKKAGGYTAAEVAAWLPAQVTVTYTGDGYTARTENRAATWDTASIGTDFGAALGKKTVNGIVALPEWATGNPLSVSIGIEFIDKNILTDAQMKLSISGWTYGEQTAPAPQGGITVADTNPAYTYLYSADNGGTWVTAQNLPKSVSGNIVPGKYQAKMAYTGDNYTGVKTASFSVVQKPLTVEKGTLEVEKRNYDGTTDAKLKEGGQPALSGVVTGDTVTIGGTLSAVFTDKGPKKNIPVTVTGFELTGRDAGYYELGNTTLTLNATINNADGTPPSSGGNSGGNDDGENGGGGNDDDGNGGGGDGGDNGGSTLGDDRDPGTPPVTPPADKTQPDPGTEGTPDKETETQPESQPEGTPKQDEEPENKDNKPKPESGQQPENVTEQTVQVSVEGGRIVVSGGMIETGSITEISETTTKLSVGDGTVIVTVVCEEERYAAGVKDTVAVANAVLTPEQIQLVNDGETIEVRIDVKDISGTVGGQDKEVIEKGLAAYQNEIPELTLGMYVDISMFIRLGEGEWDAVTSTKEPIEVIIGISRELLEEGREFYIIRSHEGEYTLLNDVDNDPNTVTISTNLFSAYAIAFKQVDTDQAQEGNTKCGLCHICPTFLGICCFIWLAIIAAVIIVVVIIVLRRKKNEKEN